MQGELVLLLAAHLVLIGLPGAAACLVAARRGLSETAILLGIGLLATGTVAMICFWAYYLDQGVGQSVSTFVLLGSAVVVGWCLFDGGVDRAVLRRLATPISLWFLGSAFILFLGFVHGGTHDSLGVTGSRFSEPLPSDNSIPLFYAEWFYRHGHSGNPPGLPGGWISSDRPPLQMGFVLMQRAYLWDGHFLNYEVIGVLLQQLWIVGLWALLSAARVGRLTRGLVMLTVLLSGVAIVNGFYVWPKLLPTAMLLGAAALVLTPLWSEQRRSILGAVLIGGLIALAQLGHGGSVFGALPLLVIAAFRGLPSWRWIGIAALVGLVLLAPWSAYQSYGDPPGNRLTKWYLGGFNEVDDRGVLQTIEDGYEEAGVGGVLHNKGQNFVAIFGGGPMAKQLSAAAEAGDFMGVVRPIRTIIFFNLVPSLGLLLLSLPAMAIGFRRGRRAPAEWRLAGFCLLAFGLGALLWALIMFGGQVATTNIHQGSYLLPVLGICACVLGFRAVAPALACWILAANAVLMLLLYVPDFAPMEDTSFSVATAALGALVLAVFAVVAGATPSSGAAGLFSRRGAPDREAKASAE